MASVFDFTLFRIDETEGSQNRKLRVITKNVCAVSPTLISETQGAEGSGEEGRVEEPENRRNDHECYPRAVEAKKT